MVKKQYTIKNRYTHKLAKEMRYLLLEKTWGLDKEEDISLDFAKAMDEVEETLVSRLFDIDIEEVQDMDEEVYSDCVAQVEKLKLPLLIKNSKKSSEVQSVETEEVSA